MNVGISSTIVYAICFVSALFLKKKSISGISQTITVVRTVVLITVMLSCPFLSYSAVVIYSIVVY